jgi:hypothetical protein
MGYTAQLSEVCKGSTNESCGQSGEPEMK